jgi:hypothetical protein
VLNQLEIGFDCHRCSALIYCAPCRFPCRVLIVFSCPGIKFSRMDFAWHIPSQIGFITNVAQVSGCPNLYIPRLNHGCLCGKRQATALRHPVRGRQHYYDSLRNQVIPWRTNMAPLPQNRLLLRPKTFDFLTRS